MRSGTRSPAGAQRAAAIAADGPDPSWPVKGLQHVLSERLHGYALEARRGRELVDAEGRDRRHPVAADEAGRAEPGDVVDEARPEQGRGEAGAALDQDAGQAAFPQRLKGRLEIDGLAGGRHLDEFDAAVPEDAVPLGRVALERHEPGR